MTSNWYSMGFSWWSHTSDFELVLYGLFPGGIILVTLNWYSMGLFFWWSHTNDFKLVLYGAFFLVESY